jgi:pimeloyl-ACP methyl ester carboxylesterase
MRGMRYLLRLGVLAACGFASTSGPAAAADTPRADLSPCRLLGFDRDALCGKVSRPLDPTRPGGTAVEIHFAVLPAVARNKKPDPVFFFAGGPGQSAIDLAGPVSRMLGRFSNRRDIVLVDQRGTGRSASLKCDDDRPTRPLRESADLSRLTDAWVRCRQALSALPHGDLRQYTTTIAMQDADAVRRALGVTKINAIGGSYGTRAVLEYLRQFPQQVRRAVIDGVAPPDMVLPMSFSTDAQSAFDALLGTCERDTLCQRQFPQLREQWHAMLRALPQEVMLQHPVTLQDEKLTLTRDMVTGMARMPLYAPALAAALPLAVSEASRGRFAPLAGLSSALSSGGGRATSMAQGMHFSVICAEDMPRLEQATDRPGADFGTAYLDMYRKACAEWPRGSVPAEFYKVPATPVPTLVLSGGIDPVTPPRHGERVSKALGAKARHVVVPNAGHGVMALGCMRDVLFRFVDADDGEAALAQLDAACVQGIPRPPAFVPPRVEGRS